MQLRVQSRLRCAAANRIAVVERKCMLCSQRVHCCRLHANGAGNASGLNLLNATLAGGKILLNKARLHLKRGRRYGLCGHNGAGKVSLRTAFIQLRAMPCCVCLHAGCSLICWPLQPCTVYCRRDATVQDTRLAC